MATSRRKGTLPAVTPDPPAPDRDGTLDDVLGLRITAAGGGTASGSFDAAKRVMQPFGVIHGGAYAAHAESLASFGTFVEVREGGMAALGMSNSTTFLRPVSEGTVEAEARAIHRGRTSWVWDVEFTANGKTCAVARVTIAVRPLPG